MEPLSSQPISESYDHLADLDLADNSDGHSRLDNNILIGSDLYWELITGETCRGVGAWPCRNSYEVEVGVVWTSVFFLSPMIKP